MLKAMVLALGVTLGLGGVAAETGGEPPRMVVQFGHTSQVKGVVVTPDGRFALTGADSEIILWDLASGAQLRSFKADFSMIWTMALSRDGRWLAFGSLKGQVWLMDLARGYAVRSLVGHTDWVHSVAFSPDGKVLATASSDRTLRLWNLETGEATRTIEDSGMLFAAGFSPDGRWLAAAGLNRAVRLWSLPDMKEQPSLEGHERTVLALAFSPDSRQLASGGEDRTVRLWDLASRGQAQVFREPTSDVNVLAFSPDGRTLAGAGAQWTDPDYAIRLWDLATGRVARELRGHHAGLVCLAFTPDGKKLLSGHRSWVRVWDPQSGAELAPLAGHASSIRSFKFSPDGHSLATAQNDATARVWDLAQGSERHAFRGHEIAVTDVAFSPDGASLASAGYDHTVRLWDLAGGAVRKTFQGADGIVEGVAFSPDGRTLFAAGGEQGLLRWKLPGGAFRAFKGKGARVMSIALSPDGRLAATTSDDNTVHLWNASGTETKTLTHPKGALLSGPNAVAFTPDGRQLLTGCQDRNGYLWSLDTGQVVRSFSLPSPVGSVAVSADGARIALGGWGGDLAVFDRNTGRALGPVARQPETVTAVGFSPDGTRLATGGWDGAARLWEAATGRELARLFSLDQGWVVITPEGAFDGSADGLKAIHWIVGAQSFPLASFTEGSYVPALLPRILAGERVASLQPSDLSKGFKLPPSVRITAPADGAAVPAGTVEVRVEATDQGGGVDEVRLYLNGKAVAQAVRGVKVAGGPGRTEVFQVELVDGENRLQAVALNTARIESNPSEITVRLRGAERQATLHVLAVGIDHYRNPAMDLNFARADAGGIAEFFSSAPQGLFRRVEAIPLFDAEATKAAILARLGAFRSLPPQDVAVIYLAGHGEVIGNTWYFLPFELVYPEREAEVLGKGLSSTELQDAVRAIGAQKVLVLLDACKSGEAMLAFAGRGVEDRKALAMLARATGVHIVAASTKDQLASEVKELGHGVFTFTLLQGLGGAAGAGPVTVRGLLAYVESHLPEVSQKYKAQAQYPVVDSRGMDFPIAAGR